MTPSTNGSCSESERIPESVDKAALDVVIVTYQSAATIAHCLDAVSRLEGLGTIVVVDHGEDDSSKIVSTFDAIVVRDPANPGFGAGQNRGRQLSTAEFLLVLNPDAVIEPEAIQEGVKTLQAQPAVAAVQGVIVDADSGEPERSAGRQLSWLHLLGRALGLRRLRRFRPVRAIAVRLPALADHIDRSPDVESDVRSLGATALLIRRRALDDVHGFDERYFMYGEDADLCARLRQVGWRLHTLPSEWATHRAGTSSPSSLHHEILWWQGAMRYAARWFSSPAWTLALTACTIRVIPLCACHPRRSCEILRTTLFCPVRSRHTIDDPAV